jgi:hypothetical protein
MVDAVVKKHWVVAVFTPSVADDDTIGTLGTPDSTLYVTLAEAQTAARTAAANTPGSYHVVYEVMLYAKTNVTPVQLYRVGTLELV